MAEIQFPQHDQKTENGKRLTAIGSRPTIPISPIMHSPSDGAGKRFWVKNREHCGSFFTPHFLPAHISETRLTAFRFGLVHQ